MSDREHDAYLLIHLLGARIYLARLACEDLGVAHVHRAPVHHPRVQCALPMGLPDWSVRADDSDLVSPNHFPRPVLRDVNLVPSDPLSLDAPERLCYHRICVPIVPWSGPSYWSVHVVDYALVVLHDRFPRPCLRDVNLVPSGPLSVDMLGRLCCHRVCIQCALLTNLVLSALLFVDMLEKPCCRRVCVQCDR